MHHPQITVHSAKCKVGVYLPMKIILEVQGINAWPSILPVFFKVPDLICINYDKASHHVQILLKPGVFSGLPLQMVPFPV